MKKILPLALFASIIWNGYAQTGNVGVGTTSPLIKLHVNGGLATTPSTAAAASAITIPANVSTFYISQVVGITANAVTATGPVEGQYLTIVNLDGDPATFAGATIPATSGVGEFQYVNAAWRIMGISSGTNNDWTKATTASTPAISTDAQYVTGNIGLGDFSSTAPTQALEVKGVNAATASSGTSSTAIVRINNTTGNGNVLDIGNQGAAPWGSWLQSTDKTNLATTYPLSLQPIGGNVGVGTTSPSDKLHIFGNNAKLIIDNGINTTSEIGIVFRNGDASASQPKSAIISKGYNSWKRADMHFVLDGAADDGPYDINTDTKMIIKAESGNVGIGTTTPGYTLDIRGSQGRLYLGANNWVDPGSTSGAGITVAGTAPAYGSGLMVVGKDLSDGQGRSVGVWDRLNINGQLKMTGGSPGRGRLLISDANGLASWTNGITFGGGTATAYGQTICSSTIGNKGAIIQFTGRMARNATDFSMLLHIDPSNNVTAMAAVNTSHNQNGGTTSFDFNAGGNWYRIRFSRASNILTLTYETGGAQEWIQGNIAIVSNTQ